MMDLISCDFLRNPFLSIFDFIPYSTVVNNYHISGPYLMDMMWPFPKVCFKHLWFCPIGSYYIQDHIWRTWDLETFLPLFLSFTWVSRGYLPRIPSKLHFSHFFSFAVICSLNETYIFFILVFSNLIIFCFFFSLPSAFRLSIFLLCLSLYVLKFLPLLSFSFLFCFVFFSTFFNYHVLILDFNYSNFSLLFIFSLILWYHLLAYLISLEYPILPCCFLY